MPPEQIHERTLVSSITVEANGEERTYPHCWVSIRHDEKRVYVWRDPTGRQPDLALPLSAVTIDWARRPRRIGQDA